MACGLTVNVVCGPQDDGFSTVLMSAATDSINWLSWAEIKSSTRTRFSNIFFSFLPYFWYPMNIENAICILAFRGLHENVISLLFYLRNGFTPFCITLITESDLWYWQTFSFLSGMWVKSGGKIMLWVPLWTSLSRQKNLWELRSQM